LPRYTFNGKEYDKETKTQDYGMRIYSADLGRFLSVDPISKKYPFYSPYHFAGNTPIWAIDLDGKEPLPFTEWESSGWSSIENYNTTVGSSSHVKVINFGNLYGDNHNYVAIRDQKIEGKWWYATWDKEVGNHGEYQKGNWQLYNPDAKKYDSWQPEGFKRDDINISERAHDAQKFYEVGNKIIINGVIFGLTAGTDSAASAASRFALVRLGSFLGDAGSQLANGKKPGELNITSLTLSASTGLPAFSTSFISSAGEFSIKEGFGKSWKGLGLGGDKTNTQVAVETTVGGVLGTLGGIGNTTLGSGTQSMYRNLRLSFGQTGSKIGMTAIPGVVSFGTNYMGNAVGNLAQPSNQTTTEKKDGSN
jgi:RHS repeat-associated protein